MDKTGPPPNGLAAWPIFSDPVNITCFDCSGTGYKREYDWRLVHRTGVPSGVVVVKSCPSCEGIGEISVCGIVNLEEAKHMHDIQLITKPHDDNNHQGIYGCRECGLRLLGPVYQLASRKEPQECKS